MCWRFCMWCCHQVCPWAQILSLLRVQHSLLRCFGPHRLHPHPLWNPHPRSDWTNVLLRESTQPIKSLQINHWGHRGVSRFMPITTGMAVLVVVDSASELLIRWRLNQNVKMSTEIWLQENRNWDKLRLLLTHLNVSLNNSSNCVPMRFWFRFLLDSSFLGAVHF